MDKTIETWQYLLMPDPKLKEQAKFLMPFLIKCLLFWIIFSCYLWGANKYGYERAYLLGMVAMMFIFIEILSEIKRLPHGIN